MTSRHTITHADELYAGNAFKAGYSPDGRRGIKMTHLYAHEFLSTAGVPALLGDVDGIFSSYATPTLLSPTALGAEGVNFLSLASGALITAGSTILEFDVPRNITWTSTGPNATKIALQVKGHDGYGEPLAEQIQGSASTVFVSGIRAFKSIYHLSYGGVTIVLATTPPGGIVSIGVGDRLGLPFNLSKKGKLISVAADGSPMTVCGATGSNIYEFAIGASSATTVDTALAAVDVRGYIRPTAPALNGTVQFTALMEVDHTTDRKAFGPPQVTDVTTLY